MDGNDESDAFKGEDACANGQRVGGWVEEAHAGVDAA